MVTDKIPWLPGGRDKRLGDEESSLDLDLAEASLCDRQTYLSNFGEALKRKILATYPDDPKLKQLLAVSTENILPAGLDILQQRESLAGRKQFYRDAVTEFLNKIEGKNDE